MAGPVHLPGRWPAPQARTSAFPHPWSLRTAAGHSALLRVTRHSCGSLGTAAPVADEVQQPGLVGGKAGDLLAAVARSRPMVTPRPVRAMTSQTAPESCQRRSSAARSMCILLRFHRMSASRRIKVARVYRDPEPDDGERVLVDRLWPRVS